MQAGALRDGDVVLFVCASVCSSVLDNIYTNISHWYRRPVVIPRIATADHLSVLMCPSDDGDHRRAVCKKSIQVRSRDANGKVLLAHALAAHNWEQFYKMATCEEMTSCFYSVVLSLLDKFLPVRQIQYNINDKPWITEKFRYVIRRRQNAWTNGRMDEYRRYRNQAIRLAKTLKKRFYDKKVRDLRRCDSRNWWRHTKRLIGQAKKSELTGLANALTDGDMAALAEVINQSVKRVSDDLKPLRAVEKTALDIVPEQFIIYPETVLMKLEKINVHKAPGPDGIPNWFLRDFAAFLYEPICAIFNASIREGHVPNVWKRANVLPVAKVNPPVSVDSDLRPISLTPTISKHLEAIVGGWILEMVGDQLDTKQFGGLKGRSTTHALVDMLYHWHAALDNGSSTRVLFVDYAKAFDHVDHNLVVDKLKTFGLSEIITVMYNVAEWFRCVRSPGRGDACRRCFVCNASRHVHARVPAV